MFTEMNPKISKHHGQVMLLWGFCMTFTMLFNAIFGGFA